MRTKASTSSIPRFRVLEDVRVQHPGVLAHDAHIRLVLVAVQGHLDLGRLLGGRRSAAGLAATGPATRAALTAPASGDGSKVTATPTPAKIWTTCPATTTGVSSAAKSP
jgi:hypothetical protein